MGIVYIPPEFTSYSTQEAFDELDFEIRNFSSSYKYISLVGDFNARTGDLSDLNRIIDLNIPNSNDYSLEDNHISYLLEANLPVTRANLDKGKIKIM